MKVCHVINGSCCRVHKLAMVQRKEGSCTPFLFNYLLKPQHAFKQYEAIFRWFNEPEKADPEVFKRAAKVIDGIIDLWHVHNERDWMAPLIREVSQKPIIWDVHDLASHQKLRDDYRAEEDASAAAADYIFCPGPAYQKILKEKYPAKEVGWFPSAVPEEMYPIASPACREGVVYEGGFSMDKWSHREWGPFFEKAGVPATIFSAFIRDYRPPAHVVFVQTVAPDFLIRQMRFFEAGVLGCPGFGMHPQLIGAMPNKLFEYLAAGIPIIAVEPPADVRKFLEEVPVGIIIDGPEQLADALKTIRERPQLRAEAKKVRWDFTMDRVWEETVKPAYLQLLG